MRGVIPPSNYLAACFYRGGTSRGLVLREHELAQYRQADRDRIICSASSPDPDGRQIDGLGGGTSSTSKVAIVTSATRKNIAITKYARKRGEPFPGPAWLDDLDKTSSICDVIYRAGQVSVREQSIDWGSTCGNMMAAVALYAASSSSGSENPLGKPGIRQTASNDVTRLTRAIRILAHDSGKVFTAHVPLEMSQITRKKHQDGNVEHSVYFPSLEGDVQIAGVPGKGPGIVIESPLKGSVLPTGNERDMIEMDGKQIDVTIIDTGLPVVFVSAKSLDIPLASLLEHPASIDSSVELMAKLEQVRQRACSLASGLRLSAPSPKLCVVHPPCDYTTTGGQLIAHDSMDVLIRTVSTGQLHRTVPATTLAALAASTCFVGSVVMQSISASNPCQASQAALEKDTRAITVGQPAGCSTASVKVVNGLPVSILMTRTARLIMRGSIPADPSLDFDEHLRDHVLGKKRITDM